MPNDRESAQLSDLEAAQLLDLLSRYARAYGPDSDPLHVLSVQTVAADLIDSTPERLLPVRGTAGDLTVWGFDYDA